MLDCDMLLVGLAGRPPTGPVGFGNGDGDARATEGAGVGCALPGLLLDNCRAIGGAAAGCDIVEPVGVG